MDLVVDFSPWQGARLPKNPIGIRTFHSMAANEDIVNGNRLGLRIGAVTKPKNGSLGLGIAGSGSTHANMGTYDASVLEKTQ